MVIMPTMIHIDHGYIMIIGNFQILKKIMLRLFKSIQDQISIVEVNLQQAKHLPFVIVVVY